MTHKNQFGTAFRKARLAQSLTQEDFANESGRTYISELEHGVKQPTLQKIDDLPGPMGLHPLTILFLSYLITYDESSVDRLLNQIRSELHDLVMLG